MCIHENSYCKIGHIAGSDMCTLQESVEMAEPGYSECFLDYLTRTNEPQVTLGFFRKNSDSLGLNSIERMLSIGPGENFSFFCT